MLLDKVRRKIHRECKKLYPKEWFCWLLADPTSKLIVDCYTPEDLLDYTTKDSILIPGYWLLEAEEYTKDNGLTIVGNCHSHPGVYDCSPSEIDLDKAVYKNWMGIVAVWKSKDTGKLRSRLRLWKTS